MYPPASGCHEDGCEDIIFPDENDSMHDAIV